MRDETNPSCEGGEGIAGLSRRRRRAYVFRHFLRCATSSGSHASLRNCVSAMRPDPAANPQGPTCTSGDSRGRCAPSLPVISPPATRFARSSHMQLLRAPRGAQSLTPVSPVVQFVAGARQYAPTNFVRPSVSTQCLPSRKGGSCRLGQAISAMEAHSAVVPGKAHFRNVKPL